MMECTSEISNFHSALCVLCGYHTWLPSCSDRIWAQNSTFASQRMCMGTFCYVLYKGRGGGCKMDITEYTQGGNCRLLTYIPSWWKNQPWLVRVGVHTHPVHCSYHHVQSCIVRSNLEGRYHRLIMEVDLQSYLDSMSRDMHSCTHRLRPRNPPSPAFELVLRGRYWSAKIDDISL